MYLSQQLAWRLPWNALAQMLRAKKLVHQAMLQEPAVVQMTSSKDLQQIALSIQGPPQGAQGWVEGNLSPA